MDVNNLRYMLILIESKKNYFQHFPTYLLKTLYSTPPNKVRGRISTLREKTPLPLISILDKNSQIEIGLKPNME